MFTYININNFKSLQSVNLELGQINIFIGPNRSGKSSVAQAIALLHQSKNTIEWNGKLVNLGNFEKVLCNNATTDKITIQFGGWFNNSKSAIESLGIYRTSQYGLHIEIKANEIAKIGYKLDSLPIVLTDTITSENQNKMPPLELEGIKFSIRQSLDLRNILQIGGSSSSGEIKREYYNLLERALTEFLATFRMQLDYCWLVPSARGFDKPLYPLHDDVSDIPSGEGFTRQAETAVSIMAYKKELAARITELIRKIIPDSNIQFNLIPPKQVQIVNSDEYGEYDITNEGFGLNQVVYLFLVLVLAGKYSTLFIDEPEIALHPASQISLCSTLVDESIKGNKQLVITTHSEHVLLGFLEAVMEKKVKYNDLKVYYFKKDEGTTRVTELKVNERGELQGGLKGFFDVDIAHMDKFLQRFKME